MEFHPRIFQKKMEFYQPILDIFMFLRQILKTRKTFYNYGWRIYTSTWFTHIERIINNLNTIDKLNIDLTKKYYFAFCSVIYHGVFFTPILRVVVSREEVVFSFMHSFFATPKLHAKITQFHAKLKKSWKNHAISRNLKKTTVFRQNMTKNPFFGRKSRFQAKFTHFRSKNGNFPTLLLDLE